MIDIDQLKTLLEIAAQQGVEAALAAHVEQEDRELDRLYRSEELCPA